MSRRTSVWKLFSFCLIAAVVAATTALPAHAQSATGTIEGSIVDQTGATMG